MAEKNKEMDQEIISLSKYIKMSWWVKSTKKVCTTLNYIEHFLTLASAVTGCISISAFASLLGILIGITSCAIRLKTCAITVGIKKYKSIIKKVVLLAKTKLNSIGVLISKALIVSNISHDEFALINNMIKEYNDMMEEIKNLKTLAVHRRF